MKTDIMLAIRSSVYLPSKSVYAAISDCMDAGLYMPSSICRRMRWDYVSLRNAIHHYNLWSMSEFIKMERVRRLSKLAAETDCTLEAAGASIGMRGREASRIMVVVMKKSFMQVRNESKQRNANTSANGSFNSYRHTPGNHLHR